MTEERDKLERELADERIRSVEMEGKLEALMKEIGQRTKQVKLPHIYNEL